MARLASICLILFTIASSIAEAQEPKTKIGPRPVPEGKQRLDNRELGDGLAPGRRSFLVLLKNPAILEELKLTDEQKIKLKEFSEKHQETLSAYFKDHNKRTLEARERFDPSELNKPGLSAEQRNQLINNNELMRLSRESNETVTRMENEADATVARKILNRRQTTRLREIQAQAEGPVYFERPEVRERLALEEDQIAEIRNISTEHNNEFRASMLIPSNRSKPEPGAEPTPESKGYAETLADTKQKVARLRVSTMKSIEKVLSNAQRKTYKNMVGEPFDFLKPKDPKTDKAEVEKASKDEPKPK
jgi:hypothetical protein